MTTEASQKRRTDIVVFLIGMTLFCLLRVPVLLSELFMDEVHILRAVAHYIQNRTIIPPWFDWPPLFSYLAVPATGVTALFGGLVTDLPASDWALIESAFVSPHLALGMRLLSLLLSAGAAAFLWFLPPDAGRPVRMLAMLIFALSPVAQQYGGWGLPESGMAFAMAGALFFTIRYPVSLRMRDLVIGGMFTGAAAAFKYNGALAGSALLVAAAIVRTRFAFVHLLISCAAVGATFLVLCPTWVLAPGAALDGFLFETRHVTTPRLGPQFPGYLGALKFLFMNERGILLGVAAVVATAVRKADRAKTLILVTPALLNFLIVGRWARMDANYWFPALVALSAAPALFARSVKREQRIVWLIFFAVLAGSSGDNSGFCVSEGNKARMSRWLAANLPPDSRVFRDGGYTPKIWTEADIQEFLNARGSRLNSQGRVEFNRRLSQAPTAAGQYESEYSQATSETLLSELKNCDWFLTTQQDLDIVQNYPAPQHAKMGQIHARRKQVYDQLQPVKTPAVSTARDWQLAHTESRGCGHVQLAFRRTVITTAPAVMAGENSF